MSLVPIIDGRLYWCSATNAQVPRPENSFIFTIDDELTYFPFYLDFGPLNMGLTFRFCRRLERLLRDPNEAGKKIIHLCGVDDAKRANAACLLACFMILVHGKSAVEAWRPFSTVKPAFKPYRDATTTPHCTYANTILDCLRGLEKAVQLGWFNYRNFDIRDYEHCERVENGDMTWIVPNKFLAFSGPTTHGIEFEGGLRTYTPHDYIQPFHAKNIKHVVRLNHPQYDEKIFTANSIRHTHLYFTDGSCPDRNIINTFLNLSENEPAAIAVHCKAGLGRTGSLIGIYCMKHYHFPAAAFIGWSRLMRPGCVLGPQQQYLNEIQAEYFALGSRITGLGPIYPQNSSPARGATGKLAGYPMVGANGGGMISRNSGGVMNLASPSGYTSPSGAQQQQLKQEEDISHNTLGVGPDRQRFQQYGASIESAIKHTDHGQGERLTEARQRAAARN